MSRGHFGSSRCNNRNLLSLTLCFAAVVAAWVSGALADDVGLRIRFGLNDEQPTPWNGKVEVSSGRVTHIGGWRFSKDDEVNGTTGWTASTHPLAQQGRGNNKNKAQAGAKKRAAQQSQPMADNGVVISMTDVTDTFKVSIQTE